MQEGVAKACQHGNYLSMPTRIDTIATLRTMRRCLPEAAQVLGIDLGTAFTHWIKTLDGKILPRSNPDFPLVVAICGGGSAGKSTLFNTLVGAAISPTGGSAGLNRRVLIATNDCAHGARSVLDPLSESFGAPITPLEKQDQLLLPGNPLYCCSAAIPHNLVLLDTPDIDTGARGEYANRDLARQSLEAADLFIYIFTNATYNNLDNTDFVARMLTGMGTRPCYLIYRVYPSFSDDDVRDHAGTVARNIYGSGAGSNVLGIYRADEDNAVSAGKNTLILKPVAGTNTDLVQDLATLDTAALRTRLLESMINDAVNHGRQLTETLATAKLESALYRQALQKRQNKCVQSALSHFPSDRVLRRFAQIWLENDPVHIKLMRRTGSLIQWPMKTIVKTVQYIKKGKSTAKPLPSEDALARQIEMDLITAANQLYHDSVSDRISMETRQIDAPAVVTADRNALRQQQWNATLNIILTQKETVLSWSAQLDDDLKILADELRSRMRLTDQIRQTFAALLNVIPATAAVTYILHTGDPVGAAGIKIKLTGLLGLHDLYALIAIPATAGMSKADRRQLEQLLAPLARTWLAHKFKTVQAVFEGHITGAILNRLSSTQKRAAELLQEISETMALAGSSNQP